MKPRYESSSLGLRIVHDRSDLRDAVEAVHTRFRQPALVEAYIEGREINVAVVGSQPSEALPPVELDFGTGPHIYTYEDKIQQSGRIVRLQTPAPLEDHEGKEAQRLARRAFHHLDCFDLARVDMRLDGAGRFYVLEVNSLATLGPGASVAQAARAAGMDLPTLLDRIVRSAWQRYYGTDEGPPEVPATPAPGFPSGDLGVVP